MVRVLKEYFSFMRGFSILIIVEPNYRNPVVRLDQMRPSFPHYVSSATVDYNVKGRMSVHEIYVPLSLQQTRFGGDHRVR